MVVKYALKYIDLIPENKRAIVIAACWCHDLVEDVRITFSDLYKIFGSTIADIVYTVSNEKGKTRAERANNKYYKGIRESELATFVKVCDRLANINYNSKKGSSMLDKYRKEHKHFKEMLYKTEYEPMFVEMEELLVLLMD
jgi:(p)ppGpp synthase/HD superfamily hydrolase